LNLNDESSIITLILSVKLILKIAQFEPIMNRLDLPFAHFSLQQDLSNAVSHSWSVDIQLDELRSLKFFGFIVFAEGPVDNPSIIKELSSRLVDTIRYQQALLEGNQVSITIDDFFEQCLQKMNSEISHFLHDISAPLPIQSWAMLVGMIAPDTNPKRLQYYTSRFGKITGWLLNNAQLDTKKLISIFDTPDILPTHQIPTKFFQNILTSTLPKNDQLFFCTPNLLNYISLTEIKHVLSTLSANPALKHFENQVQFRPNDHIVAGITLKLSPYPITNQQPLFEVPDNVQDSIDTLLQTQSDTQKLLGNQAGIGLNSIGSFFQGIKNQVASNLTPSSSEVVPGSGPKKNTSIAVEILQTTFKTGRLILTSTIVFLQKRFSSSQSSRSAMEMLHTNNQVTKSSLWKQRLGSIMQPVKQLGTTIKRSGIFKQPLFYVGLIIVVVLLFGANTIKNSQEEKAATLAQAEANLALVQENIDKIDAFLIVGRESDAIGLVQTSEIKLQEAEGIESLNDQRMALQETLEEQQAKLRKETVLTDPTELIKDATAFFSSPAQEVVLTNDSILVMGSTPKTLIKIARDSESKSTIDLTNDLTQWNSIIPNGAGSLITVASNTVTATDLTTGQGNSTVANTQSNLIGSAYFNSRLYSLSPETNQILRSNTAPNYSVVSNWINDQSIDLASARDLAIDGSIYVLLPNSVVQYNSGTPARPGLTLDAVDPALENAQKLWTSDTTNRLYIIEPNRLLVFEKTGTFINQFLIDGANDFVDLTVDTATNTVYLLSTDKLYKLESL